MSAIFLLIASGVSLLVLQGLSVERQSADYIAAWSFAEEGRNAVRFLRKTGYAEMGTVTDGGISSDGYGGIGFDGSPNYIGNYERKITVTDLNETMKRVSIVVSWPGIEIPNTITLIDYLYDWQRPY